METPSSSAARSGETSSSGLKTRASPVSPEDRLNKKIGFSEAFPPLFGVNRKWLADRQTTRLTRYRPSRKRRFYELLRNESSRRQVQPLMFVAVEGLVGALVEALAYSAPALQDCHAGNLLPVARSAL